MLAQGFLISGECGVEFRDVQEPFFRERNAEKLIAAGGGELGEERGQPKLGEGGEPEDCGDGEAPYRCCGAPGSAGEGGLANAKDAAGEEAEEDQRAGFEKGEIDQVVQEKHAEGDLHAAQNPGGGALVELPIAQGADRADDEADEKQEAPYRCAEGLQDEPIGVLVEVGAGEEI